MKIVVNNPWRSRLAGFAIAAAILLSWSAHAGNPLWNGAGSVTNNNFSNTNNWVAGNVPSGNNINNVPIGFGPLASGATNTANCDASGNSQTWTFNSGTTPMSVTLNSQQLGAATGPDVFINNSTNLQTISGTFSLFDIGGTTTSRRFNAAVGPLAIACSPINIRGDSSPAIWALELGGSSNGTLNATFHNVNFSGTLNYLKTGAGTWEVVSPLPDQTANASSLTVSAGALTLDAVNTFTGPVWVAGGATLNLLTTSALAGAVTVSNTAALNVTLTSAGTTATNGTLTLGASVTDTTSLNLNLNTFGNPPSPLLGVNGALNVNGTCTINVTNGALVVGQFPLVHYGSLAGSGSFTLGTLPAGVTANLSNNVANSSIDLVITAAVGSDNFIYWNGNISAVWDINTTPNWQLNNQTGLTYANTNQVIFDDTASGNFAVTLNSLVQPLSVTVSNSANNYSLSGSGSIGGVTGLTKSGTGVLTLNNANNYNGTTLVNSGALVLGNLNAVTGGFLNISNGAVAQPNLAGTYAPVPVRLNGSSKANGSFGGSLDFHSGGATTVVWPGQITLNSSGATIGSYGVANNVTLSGQLTGGGSLSIRPEGGSSASHTATFILSNPSNNYAGNTTMQVGAAQASATLKLGANNGLPATTALNLSRSASSGVVYLDLAGYSQTVAGLTANFGSNAVINSTGTGTLTVSNTADSVFNGAIGASGKAAINFAKQGGGTLTLNGANPYTGTTTIGNGTLALNGQITATTGLLMSSNATFQPAVGGASGTGTITVYGNVTLAGQISVNDFGIVSNTSYPVIYYNGSLTNNGITLSPLSPWGFTINTNTAHIVSLVATQQFPLVQFSANNFAVSTLTTNLSGVLHGVPAGPIWYEVRDQTNKLWDFGATLARTPWNITVRNLRAGTNTVTVFAQDNRGNIQSNRIQLTLTLGTYPDVRPRPVPSEIWWGGLSDNTQMTNFSQWPFVQRFEDGYFFHSAGWNPSAAAKGPLMQQLATNLIQFNTKYWPELGGNCPNPSPTWYQGQTNSWGGWAAACQANGIIWSEFTHDYHMENLQPVCQVNPTWPTNDQIAWWTGDLTLADGTYPYASGIWRDVFNGYYQMFPQVKVGHTSQPEYWPWNSYPAEIVNQLSFTVTNPTTAFSLNAHDIVSSFINMAGAIGHPYFSLQSDAPWDYFGGATRTSAANEAVMRQKIRVYEQYLQSRDCRHTLICNVSDAGTNYAGAVYYETSSLNSMYLHQKEGGRANRYLFESWYWGVPSAVVPETLTGSYTHLALSAIKYLKGIQDTNGTLEPLNLTPTATNGTVVQLQLQNNGDVQCLPALAGQPGTAPGVTTRYFTTNGLELTADVLTAEGWCVTNMLPPAAKTNLIAVTLASGLTGTTNANDSLEAFWNPQDPLGIVRDREIFSPVVSPLGGWQEADIGSVGVTGGSALSGDTLTLLGSGADIWGTSDAFHFVWQTNNGDGTITARVASQTTADAWSKAGVMIRETTATGARNIFIGVTPGNGVSFQNRIATGGASYSSTTGGLVAPCWVQLVRSGTVFTANYSTNGVNWVLLGSSNVTGFATSALWGLAVTAHNNTLASAATFDNVSLPNASPALFPITNRTLVAGQTLTLTNAATDPNSPPQILTFSLPVAPAGMTLNSTNGILIWRPTLAQSPSTNLVTVQVADNGTPSLSATQSFQVTVTAPVAPTIAAPSLAGGVFSIQVNGSTGPDYYLQAATNLSPPIAWLPLQTNLSPTPPFMFTDPGASNVTRKFYRVLLGP